MTGFEIIGLIIAFIALNATYIFYKRNDFNKSELIFWFIVWILFIIIDVLSIFFVGQIESLLEFLSIPRLMDVLIIMGFIILYLLCFINYINNRRIQKKLELLVREDTLQPLKENHFDK